MNIKSKVKEINDYFVAKILNEEFEVVKYERVNETIKLNITIDGFRFCIWDCTNKGSSYNGCGECFMDLSFTLKQALKLNTMIKRIKKEKHQKDEDKRDRAELARLKAKFGEDK